MALRSPGGHTSAKATLQAMDQVRSEMEAGGTTTRPGRQPAGFEQATATASLQPNPARRAVGSGQHRDRVRRHDRPHPARPARAGCSPRTASSATAPGRGRFGQDPRGDAGEVKGVPSASLPAATSWPPTPKATPAPSLTCDHRLPQAVSTGGPTCPTSPHPSRRRLVLLARPPWQYGLLGGIAHFAHADSDDDDSDNHFEDSANTSSPSPAPASWPGGGGGGGMAGATAASTCACGRQWRAGHAGRAERPATLQHHEQPGAERQPQHRRPSATPTTASPPSTGDREGRRVTAIDSAARSLTPVGWQPPAYDRLILAPGVEFSDAYGLTQADYATRTPHAWQAGPRPRCWPASWPPMQDGTFVMTIPRRLPLPAGPYERACLVRRIT